MEKVANEVISSFVIFKALVVILIALLCARVGYAEGNPLKIGLILPLTGPGAELGNYALIGAREAVEQLPVSKRPELLIEDDGLDPKRTVSAFKTLTDQKHVAIVFSLGSGPTNAIAPLAEQQKLPLISLAGDTSVSRGRAQIIRTRLSSQAEGTLLGNQIKLSGARNTILVCAENEFTLGVCDGVNNIFDKKLPRYEVSPQEADFRALITRIRGQGTDSVLVALMPGKIGLFAKQARELKSEYALWSTTWLYSSSEVASANGALEGARFVGPWPQKYFKDRIAAKFGDSPSVVYTALYFELVNTILECNKGVDLLSCYKAVDREDSTLGSFKYVNDNGDQYIRYPSALISIKNNKFFAATDQ